MGHLGYADDNNGYLWVYGGDSSAVTYRWGGMLSHYGYIGEGVIKCPSAKPNSRWEGYGMRRADEFAYLGKIRNYITIDGVNYNILKTKRVNSAASLLLVADSIMVTSIGNFQYSTMHTIFSGTSYVMGHTRHVNRLNAGCLDGHVQPFSPSEYVRFVNDFSKSEENEDKVRYVRDAGCNEFSGK